MKAKKHMSKKLLALLLSLLMLVTAVPLVAIPASATQSTLNVNTFTTIHDGSGDNRGQTTRLNVAADGGKGNTTVGLLKFDLSSVPSDLVSATLNLAVSKDGNANSSASFSVYSATTDYDWTYSSPNETTTATFNSVFGSTYTGTAAVESAKNHFGLGTALASYTLSNVTSSSESSPEVKTINITNAVKAAKAAGQSKMTIVVLHDAACSPSSNGPWSDVNVQISKTNITYDDGILPSAAENTSANNSATANYTTTITNLPRITLTHGRFKNDANKSSGALTTADWNTAYKNVLYSAEVTSTSTHAETSAMQKLVVNRSGGTTNLDLFYADTVLMYDGVTTPRTGVILFVGGTQCTIRSCYLRNSGSDGLAFVGYWKGRSSGRTTGNYVYLDHMWNWITPDSEKIYGTNNSADNLKWQYEGEKIWSNCIKFTGDFDNTTEYVKSLTPDHATWFDDGRNYTGSVSGGTPKTIKVIDYKAIKDIKAEADTQIAKIRSNPAKYDTTWVQNYVNAVKAVCHINPNTYINSSTANTSGYNTAVKNAINAYNNVKNEVLAKYNVKVLDRNGNVLNMGTYNYGTSVNTNTLISGLQGSIVANENGTQHDIYGWTAETLTVNDNVERTETVQSSENHSGSYVSQNDTQHTFTCDICGYTATLDHNKRTTKIDNDKHRTTCTLNCGYDENLNHDYGAETPIREQSCAHAKRVSQTCSTCSYVYEHDVGTPNDAHNYTWNNNVGEASNATPIKGTGQHEIICQNGCGTTEVFDCTAVSLNGTCVCSVCGQELNHDYQFVSARVEPKCNAAGRNELWKCKVCQSVDPDHNGLPIAMTGNHNYAGEPVPVLDENGNVTGKHANKCTNGCNEPNPNAIEWTTCTWGEWTEGTPATCSAEGTRTRECKVCHGVQTEAIDKLPHTLTYERVGNEHHKASCSVCGVILEVEDCAFKEAVPDESYDATCYADGQVVKACVCGNKAVTEKLTDRPNHQFDKTAKPTQIAGDKHEWVCTVCTQAIADGKLDADSAEIGKDIEACHGGSATCQDKAICEVCESEWGSLAQHNYDYENKTFIKDENDEVQHQVKCQWCSETTTSSHNWTETGRDEATCLVPELITYTCNDCKLVKVENGDAALGHDYTEKLVNADHLKSAATCKSVAVYWYDCSRCEANAKDETNLEKYTNLTYKNGAVDPTNHEATLEHHNRVEPKCEIAGTIEYWSCGSCNKNFSDAEGTAEVTDLSIEALEHSYTNYVSNNNASCTADGTETATCDNGCGTKHTRTEVGSKLPHSMTQTPASSATCTEDGTKGYWTCSSCHLVYKDEAGTQVTTADAEKIASTGHKIVEVKEQAATCEDGGNIAYWKCTVCGEYFSDAAGTQVIADKNSVNISALTHSFTGDYVQTVVDGKEYHARKCVNDGCTATGLNGVKDAKELCTGGTATCSEKAICDECKNAYGSFDANEHAWGDYVIVKATCTEDGSKTRTCGNNPEHVERTTIAKRNHSWDDGTVTEAATCTKKGTITFTCTNTVADDDYAACKDKKSEDIPMIAHTLTSVNAKDETCTEDGNIAHWTCSVCDKNFSDAEGKTEVANVTVPAKGHSMTNVPASAASCTDAGVKAHKECMNCKKYFMDVDGVETEVSAEDVVIEALGHDMKPVGGTPATCEAPGMTAGSKCSRCDRVEAGDVIPAFGHKYSTEKSEANLTRPVKNADGTWTDGYYTFTCANDSKHTTTEDVARADYDGFNASYATVKGYLDLKLTDEGKALVNSALAEADKLAQNLIVDEQSTVDAAKAELDKVAALLENDDDGKYIEKNEDCEHTFAWVTVLEPEYTKCGWEAWKCTKCGEIGVNEELEVSYREIPKLEHKHDTGWVVTKQPTCTEAGSQTLTCSICGQTITEVIPAVGHNWSAWVIDTAANCQHGGSKHRTCDRCGNTETVEIPVSTEHNWRDYMGKAPTCEEVGWTSGRQCDDCGLWFIEQKEIPATGHEDLNNDGKCETCKEEIKVSPDNCGCICHKTSSIMKILYKIVRAFWKLFGIGKSCACGKGHY
ncbi:MAG: hypothetical protein NC110_00570 [Ruminococcus sp.]|nr:hypothetical protein [Ruminococcus sp.]